MEKIIAILPNTFAGNYVTVLDEIQAQINSGNKLILLGCEGSINHCDLNLRGNKFICYSCSHCLKNSLKLIKGNYYYFKLSKFFPKNYKKDLIKRIKLNFKDIKTFKKLKYNNYDLGYAVLSTYISATRNHNPPIDQKFTNFIKFLIYDSVTYYDAIDLAIKKHSPQKLLVFNGRLHISRPALALANKYDIPIDILEVVGGYGNRPKEKVKYKNYLPHNIKNNTVLINKYWEDASPMVREQKAKDFYEKRKQGILAADRKAYVRKQKKGNLPQFFNKQKINIAIFNSSDDEMAAIGKEQEWDLLGGSQLEGVSLIAEMLKNKPAYHIYLRIHPNLKDIRYRYHIDYYKLTDKYSNITIIKPDSKISTYALLDACDIIMTFGSSVGVEATYWGKPSILMGKGSYMNLNVTYNPKSKEELYNLITKKKLLPKSQMGALKYGYYLYGRRGEEFNHFDPNKHIKPPKHINQNLYIFNLDPKRRINIASIINPFLFIVSRLVNNFILFPTIPKKEK